MELDRVADDSASSTARKKWGDEQVHIWRRSYDVPPPGGESLELTSKRVLPYYEAEIVPRVKRGEKVLVAAHGNSLRAMIKELEGMTGEQIVNTELETGVPIVYKLDKDGTSRVVLVSAESAVPLPLLTEACRLSCRQGRLEGDPQAQVEGVLFT